MPGLSLHYAPDRPPSRGLDAAVTHPNHALERLDVHRNCAFGYATYPSYPVRTVSADGVRVYFEGRRYGGGDLDAELRNLGGAMLADDGDALRAWLDRDGEYLVAAVDEETGDGALLSDVLGRLPTYYHEDGRELVATREIRFALDRVDPGFDALGVAQQLLLGYPLGERTIWDGVRRLQPATLLRFGPDREVSTRRLHRFDFGEHRNVERSRAAHASELADRFRAACRARHDPDGPTVVALSGGLDSRAAALGYVTADLSIHAATFVRDDPEVERDAAIAGGLADALGVPWHEFDLSAFQEADAAQVVSLKAGLNHCKMGFILEFYRRLGETLGPGLTYVTGDGGDKVLPDLTPGRRVRDVDDLAALVVARHGLFPPGEAAAIAGVAEDALRDSLADRLASYPETDPDARYVRFLLAERARNLLFEGEDRNRYYFWSTTPFYSLPFFRYATSVPPDLKSHNRLYEAFLEELWPRATEFRDAQFDAVPGTAKYAALQWGMALQDRFPRLGRLGRRLYKGDSTAARSSAYASVVAAQLDRWPALEDWVSTPAVRRVVASPERHDRMALVNLLTVTAAAEQRSTDETTLGGDPDRVIEP